MATETHAGSEPTPPAHRGTVTVFRLAAGATFLAVAMGAVVCATGSGFDCATWPGCQPDSIAPGWQAGPVIEFTHRLVAISSGPLILAAGVLSLRLGDLWARVLPWVALAGALVAGAFGRLIVVSTVTTWQAAIDLGCALTAMTVMGIAAVRVGAVGVGAVGVGGRAGARGDAGSGATLVPVPRRQAVQPAHLAAGSVVAMITMQVAGLFTAGRGSFTACLGWPMLHLVDGDRYPWLQVLRLLLLGVTAALVIGTILLCGPHDRLRPWSYAMAVLLAAELSLGLAIGNGGTSDVLRSAYAVIAAALLFGSGLLSAVARPRPLAARPTAAAEPAGVGPS